MFTGMSTSCFFPEALTEQAVDIMGANHVDCIEVFFSCMAEYKKPFIKKLKKSISGHGMSVYSVHALSTQFEPQLFTAQKKAHKEALEIYLRVLEAAAILGAGVYTFHGPMNVKRRDISTLDYQFIAETAGSLADIARQYGVKLAWENVHWCWYSKPSFAEDILKQKGTENLYFTLDLKQAAQSGHSPSDYLRHISGKLENVHICDWTYDEERGINPVLPFRGEADFSSLKDELKTAGYGGALIYEVYRNNYRDEDELFENYSKFKTFFSD